MSDNQLNTHDIRQVSYLHSGLHAHMHGHLPWEVIVLLVIVLLTQGICLFIDARKYSRWPWFWGCWGLLQVPLPTIVYLLVRMAGRRKAQRREQS